MLELKILLAEDVAMVRGALVALIELEPDLKVVASVENGADILPTALASQPDIAVIDIDLPRPRTLDMRETPEFGRYAKHIRHLFENLGVLKGRP